MTHHGPLNTIASTLLEMENHVGRVNVAEFARNSSIPRTTLGDAWRQLQRSKANPTDENDAFASNMAHHLIDKRGRYTRRALTDTEEAKVISLLRRDYPHGFNDSDIRSLCRENQLGLRSKSLVLGPKFIKAFKKRHGITRMRFTSRTRTLKQPTEAFEEDVTKAIEYLDTFNQLVQSIHPRLIVNCDETPAYVKNAPSHANHFPGTGGPWQWIRASDRAKITVLAACSASGNMLKPTIVAKGKSVLCERNFAKIAKGFCFLQHTQSGLTTSASFIEWIDQILIPYTAGEPAVLVLDQWPAHITQEVTDHLHSCNVTVLEVPGRGTSLLQPLYVGVFGVAKKRVTSEYKEGLFASDWAEPDRWESTVACCQALLAVGKDAILRGWQLAFPNFIDELKRRDMDCWDDKKMRKQ